MSYRNPVVLLNDLLSDLGEPQEAEEWAYDRVEAPGWFTANHPDGRMVEVWVDHASDDACGYTALTMTT